jgi:hypothetical protein
MYCGIGLHVAAFSAGLPVFNGEGLPFLPVWDPHSPEASPTHKYRLWRPLCHFLVDMTEIPNSVVVIIPIGVFQ